MKIFKGDHHHLLTFILLSFGLIVYQQHALLSSNSDLFDRFAYDSTRVHEPFTETLHAIIHLGPGKMATTTIQKALIRDVELLHQDNYKLYDYVKCRNLALSLMKDNYEDTPEWKDFILFLEEAKSLGKNIVLSSEIIGSKLWRDERAKSILQLALRPWKVRMILGYRRLFECIPSDYFQLHRCDVNEVYRLWPDEGGKSYNFTDFRVDRKSHKTTERSERWMLYFPDVKIYNIHDGDVMMNFYCNMMIQASTTCSSFTKPEKANSGWSLFYDRLAVAAYEAGLINKKLSRVDVALLAQIRQENVLNLTSYDFPLVCMTESKKQLVLNKSLTFERFVLPDWYEVDKWRHEREFRIAAEKKLCDIDTEKVLDDEEWKKYFSNPKFEISEERPIAAGFYPESYVECGGKLMFASDATNQ